MTGLVFALAAKKKPEVDISAHIELSTALCFAGIALLILFFIVRWDLWRRIFFERVDPRPAGLLRIFFGGVVLWTFLSFLKPHGPLEYSLAKFLFTDEGLWLTDMARKNYGGELSKIWDSTHGFEYSWHVVYAIWGKFSILHMRSDPAFVWSLYAVMCTSLVLMILGIWTRWTTLVSWILVESVYSYSPIFFTGGDTVVRCFMFLGVVSQWGQAYSFDSLRRRRRAITSGNVTSIPPLRKIPAWPMRIMMVQLACIYCATGMLKNGSTWASGSALYYALNLDHFYRFPQTAVTAWGQFLGIMPMMTIVTHWWEILFPLSLVGVALNAFERERLAGIWPTAHWARRWLGYLVFLGAWACGSYLIGLGTYYWFPRKLWPALPKDDRIVVFGAISMAIPLLATGLYLALRRFLPTVFRLLRQWVLGKRLWLVIGFSMHIGIDIGMNVGTFAEVMMAVYFAWLSGSEVQAFWDFIFSRRLKPGEGDRPVRKSKLKRLLLAPFDFMWYRRPGQTYTILISGDQASIRRAATLRLWDVGDRLRFNKDEDLPVGLHLRVEGHKDLLSGNSAASELIKIFPGLWWARPFRLLNYVGLRPLVDTVVGGMALRLLRQRVS